MNSAIRWVGLVVTMLAALSLGTARAAGGYTFVDLGTFGGAVDSHAYGINDAGQIVGDMRTTTGEIHGFVWQKGSVQDIGSLGGGYSRARAINNRGQVVGDASLASGVRHAFLWEKGRMRDLGTIGEGASAARAINDRGQIVGEFTASDDNGHAFLWEKGHMIDLGAPAGGSSSALAINAAGQIVGIAYYPEQDQVLAVRWEHSGLVPLGTLAGDSQSTAFGINNRGQVVGTSSGALSHGVLWNNGRMTGLADGQSQAIAINNRGDVAGTWQPSAESPTYMSVWRKGVRTTLPIPDNSAGDVLGINNRGAVVGWAVITGQGVHAVLWQPT